MRFFRGKEERYGKSKTAKSETYKPSAAAFRKVIHGLSERQMSACLPFFFMPNASAPVLSPEALVQATRKRRD